LGYLFASAWKETKKLLGTRLSLIGPGLDQEASCTYPILEKNIFKKNYLTEKLKRLLLNPADCIDFACFWICPSFCGVFYKILNQSIKMLLKNQVNGIFIDK
jgi:hypothetical protein